MYSFTTPHFTDVSKISLASQIEHQKLSVLHTGHRKNALGLQSFLLPIVFMSEEWTFGDILQHSRKNVSPRSKHVKGSKEHLFISVSPWEKVCSTGFYPSLLLTQTDWYFWGKISQQIKKKMQQTNHDSKDKNSCICFSSIKPVKVSSIKSRRWLCLHLFLSTSSLFKTFFSKIQVHYLHGERNTEEKRTSAVPQWH